MNILESRSGSIKHISITGELDNELEQQYFYSVIDSSDGLKLHITFLDANIIPADVVEKLAWLQKSRSSKFYVLKIYLYSYLYNLGIKSVFVKNKSIVDKQSKALTCMSDDVPNEAELSTFLKDVSNKYGYDFTEYQMDSIRRRVKITMLKNSINSFAELWDKVINKQEVFDQMFLDFSINTTDFFRDPEVFNFLRVDVLPYLNSFSHIKIWCAGCSSGKEPYSLAIILHELGILHKSRIYATDFNPYIVEEAKNGLYPINRLDKDTKGYKAAGGKSEFSDYYEIFGSYFKIKEYLRKNILFFQHSLTGSGILNEFQLILCRNVMIYFNTDLQKRVIELFHNSLDISGFLILGKSEGVLQNDGYKFLKKYNEGYRIFRRKN